MAESRRRPEVDEEEAKRRMDALLLVRTNATDVVQRPARLNQAPQSSLATECMLRRSHRPRNVKDPSLCLLPQRVPSSGAVHVASALIRCLPNVAGKGNLTMLACISAPLEEY